MPTVFIFDHVTQKSVDQSARKLEQDVQASIADLAYEVEGDITDVQASITSITNLTNEIESDITDVQTSITNLTNEVESITNLTNEVESDISSVQLSVAEVELELDTCVKREQAITGESVVYIDSIRTKSSNSTDTLKISDNTGDNNLDIDLSNNAYTELSYNSIPLFRINSSNNTVRAVGTNGLATNRLVPHSGSTIDIDSTVNIKGPLSVTGNLTVVAADGIATNRLVTNTGSALQMDSNVNIFGDLTVTDTLNVLGTDGVATNRLVTNSGSTLQMDSSVNINGLLTVTNTLYALGLNGVATNRLTSVNGTTINNKHSILMTTAEWSISADPIDVNVSASYSIYLTKSTTSINTTSVYFHLPIVGTRYDDLRGKVIIFTRLRTMYSDIRINVGSNKLDGKYDYAILTAATNSITNENSSITILCSDVDSNYYVLSSFGEITYHLSADA